MRVHGIMAVGACRAVTFALAVSIRLRRSTLHSSFKVSEQRPRGLLLLGVNTDGRRLRAAPTNRLWLAVAEDAEPPPVDGTEARRGRRGTSTVHRKPWGNTLCFSQAMPDQL